MYKCNKIYKKGLVIGLTGNIGVGKSSVLNYFRLNGFFVLNSDKIVAEEYKKKAIFYKEVVKLFGNQILDENLNIDKNKIFNLIKKDNNFFKELNNITNHIIVEKIKKELDLCKKKYRFSIIETPLLFEMNMQNLFDINILIIANDYKVIDRSQNCINFNEEKYIFFKKNQHSNEKKMYISDIFVYNNSSQFVLLKKIKYFTKIIKKIKNVE